MPPHAPEYYISLDVETAGPNPADYSLLSIGACAVSDPQQSFYVELQPVNDNAESEALSVSRLTLAGLAARGAEPREAMARLEAWLGEIVPPGSVPVCVAFNAAFDWMFLCDYFHRYLGRNPFGHAAIDVKSLYMGLSGATWAETAMVYLAPRYLEDRQLTHNALEDAREQAVLFRKLLEQARQRKL